MDWPGTMAVPTRTDESQVTLSADGAGSTVNKISYPYYGFFPMTSSSTWTGLGPYTITRWLDSRGRELPISVSTIGPNRRYSVETSRTGDARRSGQRNDNCGKSQDGYQRGRPWTYRGDQVYGQGENRYLATVHTPQGSGNRLGEPRAGGTVCARWPADGAISEPSVPATRSSYTRSSIACPSTIPRRRAESRQHRKFGPTASF